MEVLEEHIRKTVIGGEYERYPLTLTERTWAMFPHVTVNMVISLTGELSEQRLRAAVEKVQSKWKILNANLEITESKTLYWVIDNTLPFTIKKFERESELHWRDVLKVEQATPFVFDKRPLFRINWLYSASEKKSDIIISFHHSIGDGISTSLFVKEMLENLGDETRVIQQYPLLRGMDSETIPSFTKPLTEDQAKKSSRYNQWWLENKIEFTPDDYKSFRDIEEDQTYADYQLIQIDERSSKLLLSKCRREKVKLNTFLTTLFQKETDRLYCDYLKDQRKHKDVLIALSGREHFDMPIDEDFGLYAIATSVPLAYDTDKNFWDNARDFQNSINSAREKKEELFHNEFYETELDVDLFNAILNKSLYRKKEFNKEKYPGLYELCNREDEISEILKDFGMWEIANAMIISNLGRLDLDKEYGDFKLNDLFVITQPAPYCELMVCALSCGGKLNLTLQYDTRVIPVKMAEKISESVKMTCERVEDLV